MIKEAPRKLHLLIKATLMDLDEVKVFTEGSVVQYFRSGANITIEKYAIRNRILALHKSK